MIDKTVVSLSKVMPIRARRELSRLGSLLNTPIASLPEDYRPLEPSARSALEPWEFMSFGEFLRRYADEKEPDHALMRKRCWNILVWKFPHINPYAVCLPLMMDLHKSK